MTIWPLYENCVIHVPYNRVFSSAACAPHATYNNPTAKVTDRRVIDHRLMNMIHLDRQGLIMAKSETSFMVICVESHDLGRRRVVAHKSFFEGVRY